MIARLREEVKSECRAPNLFKSDSHEERTQDATRYRIAVPAEEIEESLAQVFIVLGLRVGANSCVVRLGHRDCTAGLEDPKRLTKDRLAVGLVNVFEKPHDVPVIEGPLRPGQLTCVSDAEVNVEQTETSKVLPGKVDLPRFEVNARQPESGECSPEHTQGRPCRAPNLQEALALAVGEIMQRE